MSGIFSTFNIAKRGLFAQQNAVSTTSHNIANANTEGYSRQRVHFETTPAHFKTGVGVIGTGVDIASINRIRDAYLDTQVRYETGILGRYNARQEILEQVEMVFMEPSESGLSTVMGKMWDAWQELSKSPESSYARAIVRDQALTFTDSLNHMYEQLETLKSDSINLTEKKVLDAHSIIDQIKSLNDQISRVVIKGETPNDLMDRRDLLLDQLSVIVDFKTTEDKFGRISIESGGIKLLSAAEGDETAVELSVVRSAVMNGDSSVTVTLARGGDSINGVIVLTMTEEEYRNHSFLKDGAVVFNDKAWDGKDLSGLEPFKMSNGELLGYQSMSDEISMYQDQLNGLARALAYAVNTIHTDSGSHGVPFFVGDGGSSDLSEITAGNITINQAIIDNPKNINTATLPGNPEGDGGRALAIAQLRSVRLPVQDFIDDPDAAAASITYNNDTMSFENVSGGGTFEGYYKDMIAKLGISSQQAVRMVENQETLTGQLLQRRYSVSGVSIDEEVANLILFQHAYQANANVIYTLNAMLDTLINRMGV
ncbi:MAG TPA: flagellar hook-associated protein FlgK [Candidatus Atribacteria bacterium]|nr:flagellar hook-associated protein FlgK [Candidatus Atribacteria bacterium]